MRPTAALLAAFGIVSGACAGTGASSARISVRDSAGIEIVESFPPARESQQAWVIDSVPQFDIGADPSDPNQEFTTPGNPVRLPNGRIAVADPGTQEIRFFDSTGTWLRNVGRKGEGPGEFSDLRWLYPGPGDSLYAYEPGAGFVSVLNSEGSYVRRARLQAAGEGRFAVFRGVFSNGRWLVDGSKVVFPTAAGVFRSLADLFEYSAAGQPLDSVASMPGWEVYGEPFGKGGYRYSYLPFRRGSVTVVTGARAIFGATERVDLRVYRSGSGIERIIRVQLPERPLTRVMLEGYLERELTGWTRASAEEKAEYRRKVLGASYPPHVPAIDTLVVGANGDLWLREYAVDPEASIRYVLTDPMGRFKAFAVGPARFTPSWIGEYRVVGLWRDPDDVVHVRAYELRR